MAYFPAKWQYHAKYHAQKLLEKIYLYFIGLPIYFLLKRLQHRQNLLEIRHLAEDHVFHLAIIGQG